jgi:hypothetical protein
VRTYGWRRSDIYPFFLRTINLEVAYIDDIVCRHVIGQVQLAGVGVDHPDNLVRSEVAVNQRPAVRA